MVIFSSFYKHSKKAFNLQFGEEEKIFVDRGQYVFLDLTFLKY